MYHVLLPVDVEQDRVQAQLETLTDLPADHEAMRVTVLHVYEKIDPPAETGWEIIDELNESLDELRDVPETVEYAEERLDEAGIDHDRQEVVGEPADAITSIASDLNVDCLLVGMQPRTPVGKIVFGSVTQSVLQDIPHPVFIAER